MGTELYLTLASGGLVGLVLALVGGGGSILAVPLLIFVVGVPSTHVALGTSAVAVALTALANLVSHWRAGHVKWRCAGVFSAAGIFGAYAGSSLAKVMDGDKLLILFGALMLVVGLMMLRSKGGAGDANVKLTKSSARIILPRLLPAGFAVGSLSGFFGIGGGFLIVPGLIFGTGMPLAFAIGTSLVSVFAFGATTAANYAASGLVDWVLAGQFIAGGVVGGLIGIGIGKLLGKSGNGLRYLFAGLVIVVGTYVIWQAVGAFLPR